MTFAYSPSFAHLHFIRLISPSFVQFTVKRTSIAPRTLAPDNPTADNSDVSSRRKYIYIYVQLIDSDRT